MNFFRPSTSAMIAETPPLPDAGALYDEAACGLLLTDRSGTILKVNRTFCRWLGMQQDELCGRRFDDLLTTGGRIFYQTHFDPLLQLQGSATEVKLELVSGAGESVPVLVNALRRGAGADSWVELAVFMARDRHAYEKELLRARKQAEQLAAAKWAAEQAAQDRSRLAEQMIGIVSHDLRNPLFTIMLGATSLQQSILDEKKAKSYLGYIMEAAQRAERLVEDLLDFTAARIGQGIAIDSTPINLHAVVAKCVEELRVRWPGHVLHHLSTGNGTCFGDSRRLFQVIGNLVANAVTYGDAHSPIEVMSHVGERECSISVHNHGQPIAPERLPTLFEAMVRGTDQPTMTRNVGLGLYIVGQIARAHDGRVTVSSTSEAGTTFTFAFSRNIESGQEADACAAPAGV